MEGLSPAGEGEGMGALHLKLTERIGRVLTQISLKENWEGLQVFLRMPIILSVSFLVRK